ncbi:MAG: hypothetical protein RL026_2608 [Pseudomonadota bacterium]
MQGLDTIFSPVAGTEAHPQDLWLLPQAEFDAWLQADGVPWRAWIASQGFRPERGRLLALPDPSGGCAGQVAGLGADLEPDLWLAAGLANRLPTGRYRLRRPLQPTAATAFELGWRLGQYRYGRFSQRPAAANATLDPLPGADPAYATAAAAAIGFGRDLVNAPANVMGPEELESAARELAASSGGTLVVTRGPDLHRSHPLVEAVGRASPRGARVLDLHFPRPGAPQVVLVGKGVCFDSGGLDIKPPSGMLLMKKDMGGAAAALALAMLLRRMDAPIDLRVLVPAVENSVGGAAFRPGDVLVSRKGLSVEIGNTDAEGRLVLADTLTQAFEAAPDLVINLATLTGAARVALGPDLPAVFSGDDELLAGLKSAGGEVSDPVWPMPLWEGYMADLDSPVADLNNVASHGLAGAVIGALFLRRFVTDPKRWIHVDLYAWNPRDRPGRPAGGEVQAVRAIYHLLRKRFG